MTLINWQCCLYSCVRIQPGEAVSLVRDADLDDGALVVHEVLDEAELLGSERLGGDIETDVLV